jgi:CelD/BcsL family acetyltransferase involved in cellulose biosynthesis
LQVLSFSSGDIPLLSELNVIIGLEVVIYDTWAQLQGLRPEWDALVRGVFQHSGTLGYAYATAAWRELPKTSDTRLTVIAVRKGGVLACLWPLYVDRDGSHMVACHLGCGGNEEYAGPLLGSDPGDRVAGELALRTAKGLADVLKVYNLLGDGQAAAILAADGGVRWKGSVWSPVVSTRDCETFETWLSTRSGNFRSGLRREHRELSAQGDLVFRRMAGPVDGPACVEWIFAHKREQLAAHGVLKSWVHSPQALGMFAALAAAPATVPDSVDDVEAYALTLDGQTVAAGLVVNGDCRMEPTIAAFDPRFSRMSPGNLLIAEWTALAVSRGVDLDFRITQEAYKLRWSDRFDRFDSYVIACTPKGAVAVGRFILSKMIRGFLVKWSPRIKPLLGR